VTQVHVDEGRPIVVIRFRETGGGSIYPLLRFLVLIFIGLPILWSVQQRINGKADHLTELSSIMDAKELALLFFSMLHRELLIHILVLLG
jgi:hypothetical protein